MTISNTPVKLIVCLVVVQLAGVVGSLFTTPAIPTWFATLSKPSFSPPNWVFAPVWTILFLLMGVAAFLVWRSGWQKKKVKIALSIFCVQLVLNTFWSIIFFGWQNPQAAFVEIIFLWLAILVTIIFFAKVSRVAAWLLLPYILWVSFASVLNFSLWQLNFAGREVSQGILCTQEAKICPDGSAVGRVGPNCEFATCPSLNVSKELADCLPKSDLASQQKCQGLLGNTLEKADLIKLETPGPSSEISNPLIIQGQARGGWFFEGSFPVVLVDWDGRIIAEAIAQSQGEWMTKDFVPFKANLIFSKPDTTVSNRGALILRKDNPSGLPQNDDALEVPIFFK